jgi:hypothetical protein
MAWAAWVNGIRLVTSRRVDSLRDGGQVPVRHDIAAVVQADPYIPQA